MTAVTRRTRGPDKAEPSSIFISGGELEKVMGTSIRMRVLVATVTALWAVTAGLLTFEMPTIDSRNESIVATSAIFIGGSELKEVMRCYLIEITLKRMKSDRQPGEHIG